MQLEQLAEMMCCPETRQDLRLATAGELERLNQAIMGGKLEDLSGEAVTQPVTGALVRADEEVLYLVRQHVPIMISEKAVRMADVMDDTRYLPEDGESKQADVEKLPLETPEPETIASLEVTGPAGEATADTSEAESLREAK